MEKKVHNPANHPSLFTRQRLQTNIPIRNMESWLSEKHPLFLSLHPFCYSPDAALHLRFQEHKVEVESTAAPQCSVFVFLYQCSTQWIFNLNAAKQNQD